MMFGKIMNWITLKTGCRPNAYSIFVWMRQVNERLGLLEKNKTAGSVEQRVEFEAYAESIKDQLASQMAELTARIECLEQGIDNKEK